MRGFRIQDSGFRMLALAATYALFAGLLPAQNVKLGSGVKIAGGSSTAFNPGTTVSLFDDFLGGNGYTWGGSLNWNYSAIGSGSLAFDSVGASDNVYGATSLRTTGATANSGGVLFLSQDGAGGDFNFNKSAWTIYFRIAATETTTIRIRAGVAGSITSDPPVNGAWVRYDTGSSDTTWKYVGQLASTPTTAAGCAISAGTYSTFIMSRQAGGDVKFQCGSTYANAQADSGQTISSANLPGAVAIIPFV
jgi:hypothetical protein